jgi:hypothetical protein
MISSSHRHNTHRHKRRTSVHSAGFETTIPAIKCLQTCALDRTATSIQQHDIRNPFCLCLVRLELWSNTECLLQTALVAGRSPQTFAFINCFLNSSRPERTQTDRQTGKQKPAPSCCRRKRLFNSSLMTISRLHGDHNKRNRKLIFATGLTTGK